MFGVNINNDTIIPDEDLDEFLDSLKIDYNHFYRGIVVDNNDPQGKGRVKIRIPQIYGVSTDDVSFVATPNIPWATCAVLPAGNDSGSFLPPNIGDTVFVTFEGGQSNYPIYFGGIYTLRRDDNEDVEKAVGSYNVFNNQYVAVDKDDLPQEVKSGTERVLYKSLKGATIYIDDRDGGECIKIIDQSGQSIIMENLSKETLKRRGSDVGKNPSSQIVLTNTSGDSITLSRGKIHLKSPNILFETDNFEQIGLNEFSDEINLADIILGKAESLVTLNFKNMRTGESLTGTTTKVYQVIEGNENLVGTYSYISNDYLELNLGVGEYRIQTILAGYYESNINVTVEEETPQTIDVFMSRETTEDNVQIVLTWNDMISDMDSHTKIYNQVGTQLGHVFYSERDYIEDDINVVNLDVDDTDGFGPETTTINKTFNYKYLFYVHRYSSGNILDSASNVKVYDKGRLIKDIDMPTGTYSSEYNYWNVLEYDFNTGNIRVINEITASEPSL